MRFFRRSLVGLFLLSLTLGLLVLAGNTVYGALQARWSDDPGQRPGRERVLAVNVLTLEPAAITPILTSFGEIRSRRSLEVRAPIAGRIVELSEAMQEGGAVTRGDLLARIDPAGAEANLAVARADLAEAEAERRDATRALDLARDELVAAEEQAQLRVRALERQRDLRARGVGTDAAVETAELASSSAGQAVLSRRQAMAQAEARLDQSAILIERRQIALRDAERALNETSIYAAFDGRLANVTAVAGGLVSTNERLAEMIDPDLLEVSFRVSTEQYTRLIDENGRLAQAEVEIVLDVLGTDLVRPGRLIRESAAVGEGTTGRLLFAVIEEPRGLRPGDFVTIRVREPQLEGVVQVPASAIDATGTLLLLGEEDRLETASARLLRRQEDDVILRVGPELAGREIVAERSPLLGAGIKVRPVRPGGAEGQQAAAGPGMLELDEARRARLIAFVEGNTRLPEEARARMLDRLSQERVPAEIVQRIEARMGS